MLFTITCLGMYSVHWLYVSVILIIIVITVHYIYVYLYVRVPFARFIIIMVHCNL